MNASGFFRGVADLDCSTVSDRDLVRLEQAFRSVADSIAAARNVLGELQGAGPSPVRGKDAGDQLLPVSEEDRLAVEQAIAAMSWNKDPAKIESRFRERILEYFNIDGWVVAGVLSCLVRLPGRFVSHADLAAAAGVTSGNSSVVRVYICQLRAHLRGKGFSASAIETRRGAYRIVRSAAFEVVTAMAGK